MSFDVKTLVVWDPWPTDECLSLLEQRMNEMQAQGKTDNVPNKVHGFTDLQIQRRWQTREAAQEYIDFVQQFEPMSAEILPN